MNAETIELLADLIIDLDRAGVQQLVADGDQLRYRPRSALSPDLAQRLRIHKADLLATLRGIGVPTDARRASESVTEATKEIEPAPVAAIGKFNRNGAPRVLTAVVQYL
jgi:hypothetical protein